MSQKQQNALRNLILELANKHSDQGLKRGLRYLTQPGPLLAAAIGALYADHWDSQDALRYFCSLGISDAELLYALGLLRPHLKDAAQWYNDWQPAFN